MDVEYALQWMWPELRVLMMEKETLVHADRVYSWAPFQILGIWPELYENMRRLLRGRLGLKEMKPEGLLFVQRAPGSTRVVSNVEEICDGFRRVNPGLEVELTTQRTQSIFETAARSHRSLVVGGFHGAGLGQYVMMMQAGTLYMEIYGWPEVPPWWTGTAGSLGIHVVGARAKDVPFWDRKNCTLSVEIIEALGRAVADFIREGWPYPKVRVHHKQWAGKCDERKAGYGAS
jgi:hypothetical protein